MDSFLREKINECITLERKVYDLENRIKELEEERELVKGKNEQTKHIKTAFQSTPESR